MNNRTQFVSYIRYVARCPRCGHDYGVIGQPVHGERIGCSCGNRLVVTKDNDDNGWHLYLEVDTGQIVNP